MGENNPERQHEEIKFNNLSSLQLNRAHRLCEAP